jgi:glycosyltransferase involved in cell wall biosynthesis
MKVLFVITGLGPSGGAERMLFRLARGMSAHFERRVVSLGSLGAVGEDLQRAGIEVHALGMKGLASAPAAIVRLSAIIRAYRPDVVNTWMYHADLIGGLASRLAGVRAIAWNIRNSDLSTAYSKASTRAVARLNATLSGRVPRLILCCSEAARQIHVAQGYCADRFVVIPNGFDLGLYRPDPMAAASVRDELSIPRDAPLIGLIARWNPQKNHRGFVEAAAELMRRIQNAHFLLAGAGVTPDNLELSAWINSARIAERVHVLGLRTDIPRLTAALDVATSTSIFGEAFPNVLGEAMACGVPCVATDIGDSSYIIGDTGRVVRSNDAQALATAWEQLLRMPEGARRELGERARERVSINFDLGKVMRRYEQVFMQLAA